MPHRHTPKTNRERAFAHPVSKNENRAAHGGITVEQTCSCGAVRLVNINGRHEERGEWTEPDPLASR